MVRTAEHLIPTVQERVPINSNGRRLEGILAYPETGTPTFTVLVAGPHPFLGGNLENNVIRALLTDLPPHGGLVMAFNYAGVGVSEGGPSDRPAAMSEFWQTGRIDYETEWANDAITSAAMLAAMVSAPRVLAGYSFGCWTASRCIPHSNVDGIVLLSPNPLRHDFSALRESTPPLLVVSSDNDFSCSLSDVKLWFDDLRAPKTFELMNTSEHFFRGQEREVCETVIRHLYDFGISDTGHDEPSRNN